MQLGFSMCPRCLPPQIAPWWMMRGMRRRSPAAAADMASGGCGGAPQRLCSVACSGCCCSRGTSSRAAAVLKGLLLLLLLLPLLLPSPFSAAASNAGSGSIDVGGQLQPGRWCSVTRVLSSSQAPSSAVSSTASHQYALCCCNCLRLWVGGAGGWWGGDTCPFMATTVPLLSVGSGRSVQLQGPAVTPAAQLPWPDARGGRKLGAAGQPQQSSTLYNAFDDWFKGGEGHSRLRQSCT